MCDCLPRVIAVGASWGLGLCDTVEVEVERCVLRTQLDEKAGLASGEGGDES